MLAISRGVSYKHICIHLPRGCTPYTGSRWRITAGICLTKDFKHAALDVVLSDHNQHRIPRSSTESRRALYWNAGLLCVSQRKHAWHFVIDSAWNLFGWSNGNMPIEWATLSVLSKIVLKNNVSHPYVLDVLCLHSGIVWQYGRCLLVIDAMSVPFLAGLSGGHAPQGRLGVVYIQQSAEDHSPHKHFHRNLEVPSDLLHWW